MTISDKYITYVYAISYMSLLLGVFYVNQVMGIVLLGASFIFILSYGKITILKFMDYLFFIMSLLILSSKINSIVVALFLFVFSSIYILCHNKIILDIFGKNYLLYFLLLFLIPLLMYPFYLFHYNSNSGDILKFAVMGHIVYYSFYVFLIAFILNMSRVFSYRLILISIFVFLMFSILFNGGMIIENEFGGISIYGKSYILLAPMILYFGLNDNLLWIKFFAVFFFLFLFSIFIISTLFYAEKALIISFCIQWFLLFFFSKNKFYYITFFILVSIFLVLTIDFKSDLFAPIYDRFFALSESDGEGSTALRLTRYIELMLQLIENYVPIILGTGLGMPSYLSTATHLSGTHSGFIGFLSSTGLINTLIYLLLIYSILRMTIKKVYSDFVKILISILISLLVHSIFEDRVFPVGDLKFILRNIDFIIIFSLLFLISRNKIELGLKK